MHADVLRLSTMAGASINRAGGLGLLTDAGVAAADTLNGLDTFVNGVAVHADQYNYKPRVKLAWRVDAGITDATVLSLTTVAGLSGLTAIGTNTTTLGLLPND